MSHQILAVILNDGGCNLIALLDRCLTSGGKPEHTKR